MRIVMLGTGAALPDPDRCHTSILITLDSGRHLMLDCGHGATRQLIRADVNPAEVLTSHSPRELLDLCLEAEQKLKRVRQERWGPRLIDIDILIFGDRTVHEEGLEIPHPRMLERAFVLAPLAEIAPDFVAGGRTLEEHLTKLDTAGIERLQSGRDWWKKPE